MPDEPPIPAGEEPPPIPAAEEPPPILLPPVPEGGLPGVPPRTAVKRFGGFLGGCLVTCLLGAVLAMTVYGNTRQTASCGLVQLLYVVPAVFFLFRKGRRNWALGFLFGGAVVFLIASMCNNFSFH